MKNKKYKILSEDVVKSLVDFLDEIQFDAAGSKDTDSMHKVNFCSWAIEELLNSYDGYLKEKGSKKYPKKKSRNDYIDETFLDWNLPEMTDEEYEKLVDQFDSFLKGWEKEYNKKNPQKKKKKKKDKFRPRIEDVAEHCSLDEIRDMLLDDPELSPKERFDLYYEEHKRVEKEKYIKKSQSLEQMLKKLNINLPPEEEKN